MAFSKDQYIDEEFKAAFADENHIANQSFIPQQTARAPKIKVALLHAYRGTGYFGSQMQISRGEVVLDTPTIELEILRALAKAKYIPDDHVTLPQKCAWGRSARTDKGVHAACNTIQVRLSIPYADGCPEVLYVWKRAMRFAKWKYYKMWPFIVQYFTNKITALNGIGDITEPISDVTSTESKTEDTITMTDAPTTTTPTTESTTKPKQQLIKLTKILLEIS
eukprot:UN06007